MTTTFARHLRAQDAERQQGVIEEADRLGWAVAQLGPTEVKLTRGNYNVTIRTFYEITALDLSNVLAEATAPP